MVDTVLSCFKIVNNYIQLYIYYTYFTHIFVHSTTYINIFQYIFIMLFVRCTDKLLLRNVKQICMLFG